MHTLGLEDLRSLSDVFRMTDHNMNFTGSSAIRNLHPILTRTQQLNLGRCKHGCSCIDYKSAASHSWGITWFSYSATLVGVG